MRRSALRTFIERLVVASLQVVTAAGCNNLRNCEPGPPITSSVQLAETRAEPRLHGWAAGAARELWGDVRVT